MPISNIASPSLASTIMVCLGFSVRPVITVMYENGSDEQVVDAEEILMPIVSVLPHKSTAHLKNMWNPQAVAAKKNEAILKQNLVFLYVLLKSICDNTMDENQFKHTWNTMKLLQVIRQLMH